MRKWSHPLHICRGVKELRLLRPLLVSAHHSFPSKRLAPSLSHLLVAPHAIPRSSQRRPFASPTYTLASYSADKGMEGGALSPATPPIVPHTTTGRPSPPTPLALDYQCKNACSSFPCQPLAFSQVILLLHAFDQLVSLARKPVYLFPASLGEPRGKPVQTLYPTGL